MKYMAFDGKVFETKDECEAYEMMEKAKTVNHTENCNANKEKEYEDFLSKYFFVITKDGTMLNGTNALYNLSLMNEKYIVITKAMTKEVMEYINNYLKKQTGCALTCGDSGEEVFTKKVAISRVIESVDGLWVDAVRELDKEQEKITKKQKEMLKYAERAMDTLFENEDMGDLFARAGDALAELIK